MKRKPYVIIFILLLLSYLALLIFLPADPATLQKYNISSGRARLLGLGIGIPMSIIWLVALYGFYRFKNYAEIIAKDKQGKAFRLLANGLTVLGFSLPINSVLSSALSYYTRANTHLVPASDILRSYVALLLQLVAFLLISKGTIELLKTSKPRVKFEINRYVVLAVIVFSSVFTWLVTGRAAGDSTNDIYYLPSILVVLTLVIPYLFIWYIGFVSIYRLYLYNKLTVGILYKSFLKNLIHGMSILLVLSVMLRLILTLSERLSRLDITPILLLVYLILALNAAGYGLVARGARQLKKIEEV